MAFQGKELKAQSPEAHGRSVDRGSHHKTTRANWKPGKWNKTSRIALTLHALPLWSWRVWHKVCLTRKCSWELGRPAGRGRGCCLKQENNGFRGNDSPPRESKNLHKKKMTIVFNWPWQRKIYGFWNTLRIDVLKFFYFWNRVSLCSPDWAGTLYID